MFFASPMEIEEDMLDGRLLQVEYQMAESGAQNRVTYL